MQLKQLRVLQSLRRVQAWCAANPGLVPAPVGPSAAWVPLTRQLDAINTFVAQLTDAAAEQDVQARHATLDATSERAVRKHLRDEMRTVTQVAQALRKSVPGIGTIKMPSPNASAEVLLKASVTLRKLASTYEPVLVEQGLEPDFLAQLDSAAAALVTSVDGRGSARASQVSATEQVAVNISLGHQFVSLMDSALSKRLRSDSAKLAEWKNAKRVTVKGVSTPATLGTLSIGTPVVSIAPPVAETQPVVGSTSTPDVQAA